MVRFVTYFYFFWVVISLYDNQSEESHFDDLVGAGGKMRGNQSKKLVGV